MFVSELGVHDVERLLSPVEAVFDERPKHAVLLVQAIEERAHVTVPAESTAVELGRTIADSHVWPPREWLIRALAPSEVRDEGNDRAVILKSEVPMFVGRGARVYPTLVGCASLSPTPRAGACHHCPPPGISRIVHASLPHVVIVGGGFGGLTAARALADRTCVSR